MKAVRISTILFVIGIVPQASAFGGCFTGTVTRVIDGDTIVVTPHSPLSTAHSPQSLRVRLADIDAPELGQAFGEEAREFLVEQIAGKSVRIQYGNYDRYGRLLGAIYIGSRYINVATTEAGYAWRLARAMTMIHAMEWRSARIITGLWIATSLHPDRIASGTSVADSMTVSKVNRSY